MRWSGPATSVSIFSAILDYILWVCQSLWDSFSIWESFIAFYVCCYPIMHLSMLSPSGGGPRAYVGHLTFQKIFWSKSPPWGPKTGSNKIKYPHLREVISLKFIVVVVYILQIIDINCQAFFLYFWEAVFLFTETSAYLKNSRAFQPALQWIPRWPAQTWLATSPPRKKKANVPTLGPWF